ncbi:hypothetical protein PHYPSEUDO_009521 [Phytophthora pseudosyringae]|uniref:Uncharacterized protein n=1 Tax=Phytophthora pseudosyringae TaxID=221518 RepID=A0A8T1VBN8_9STRA|nr:hypothetical protein PHYPSEUDO_009521 [Phytophthora pseudosyringae]
MGRALDWRRGLISTSARGRDCQPSAFVWARKAQRQRGARRLATVQAIFQPPTSCRRGTPAAPTRTTIVALLAPEKGATTGTSLARTIAEPRLLEPDQQPPRLDNRAQAASGTPAPKDTAPRSGGSQTPSARCHLPRPGAAVATALFLPDQLAVWMRPASARLGPARRSPRRRQ